MLHQWQTIELCVSYSVAALKLLTLSITISVEPKDKFNRLTIVDCNITRKIMVGIPIVNVTIIERELG